jgi:2-methylfumaryl-CoA isomerase
VPRPDAGLQLHERVVELSAFVAAPFAGMTLARMGCDVLRVDPPQGGLDFRRWPVTPTGESLFWAGLNKGKRSVAIDFRRPEGRELVAELVLAGSNNGAPGPRGAVLLTNLGARGPLQHSSLVRRRPDAISVEVEGHRDGRSAVDYTVAAGSGVPLLTGPEDHIGPVNSPLPTWDIATGLNAALAAREAMWQRLQTGRGVRACVALADVAVDVLSALGFLEEQRLAAQPRTRDGNYLYGAFGRDFELADGARVMVVAITPRQWSSLVDATGISAEVETIQRATGLDLSLEGDRWHARHEIASVLERWCSRQTLDGAAAALEANGACWGLYGAAPQALAGPPPGPRQLNALPVRFDGEQPTATRGAPALGQHTEEVLSGVLGLSQYEVGRYYDRGLVAGRRQKRGHGQGMPRRNDDAFPGTGDGAEDPR